MPRRPLFPYPTNLTPKQWKAVEAVIPRAKPGGRPRKYSMSRIVNAILYVNRTQCSWRMLPIDFPPWQTVYEYYKAWMLDGTMDKIERRLLELEMRELVLR